MFHSTCYHCDDSKNLLYDHNEGTIVCTECGLVNETNYMVEDTFYSTDETYDFLDHECYEYYPLIGLENDVPLLLIKNAYDKSSKIINIGNFRGSNKVYIRAASFFLICKEHHQDKTYEEICNQYNISHVKLSKGLKICIESGLFANHFNIMFNDNEILLFNKYLSRFSISDKKITRYIRRTFFTIIESTKEIMIGKSIKTIVSSILCYIFERSEFSKKIPYTKEDISNHLHITTVTLNKVMNLISDCISCKNN